MINEEIKNIKCGKGDLRKFGITMGIVLLLLGGFSWWRGKDFYIYFLTISAVFFFFGLVFPTLLKPINKLWMSLAILMSWFMTRVVLGILFYAGITPIGFLSRVFGKDFLKLKFNKNTERSYWVPKERREVEKTDYERQF
ncbi:MAG: hypothetical protein CV087_18880 [Candidatus Brocadia sp. WS118]|nr:MAG: hypothetical protein CV087_18880 [Candidatus Brocadia sp. WS118]